MGFSEPIMEVLKCIGPRFCKYIEYHRKLEEYKKNLIRILHDLEDQKDQIKLRLEAECGVGKLSKPEVDKWLINVQKIIDEAKNIEDTFQKVKCFTRVLLAELVDKKIQEAKEYYEKGTSLSSFNSLVIDAPPPVVITLPTTRLAGETTPKKNMEEIWGHLMGNEIQKIGVFGMGGAGKTTIVTHLNNRLVEENKFTHVIWVTVSHTLDLIKVQEEIAIVLKQSLSEIEDQKVRAKTLLNMLKGKRFVLILDDMWEAIRLEEIGIPEPTKENGCKLVITTRSLDVCRSMGCKTVQVKPLSEKEALELFFEKTELDDSKPSTLKEIVKLVAKRCAGLPLAIVTIASSLKGEDDIREWNTALHELSNNVKTTKVIYDEVFVRLKFSYDGLKDERIQRCFLYCALYPEDHDIRKDELVDCWIAEGLVDDEMANLKATEDRDHSIIKILVNNCLLLESTDSEGRSCVKLHYVVRDMALKHITSKSPLFMVKAGMKLKELPSEEEWKGNLDKVSLMDNLIREIPSSLSPNCQILSTLLLQGNPLRSIPESFFSHMHGLKTLNLSRTEIESLPNSISELKNLTALLLRNCSLRSIPESFFSHMHELKTLDLSGTEIESLPNSISELTNLTALLLRNCSLRSIPESFFSHMHELKTLDLSGTEIESLPNSISELTNLTALLLGNCSLRSIPESFFFHMQGLKTLDLSGTEIMSLPNSISELTNLTALLLRNCRLRSIPESFFSHMQGLKILNLSGTGIESLPNSISELTNLTALLLGNCSLRSIPESFFSHMHELKTLDLSGTGIESLPNSISELTNLTALLLQNCSRLKRVPSLARLRTLEKLELGNTGINEVPAGMEMLANLTSLDLLCSELHMIPARIFSKLCRLQKLQVNWGLETQRVAVEEAATLKKLDRLLAQFHNLQDFNCYVKYLNSQGRPDEYCLFLNNEWKSINDWKLNYDVNKAVILNGCNICGREEDSVFLPKEVESLVITHCGDVRTMSNIPTFNTLERLEILRVEYLGNLTGILLNASESSPAGQYPHLKSSPAGQYPQLKVFVGREWWEALMNASESSPGQYSRLKVVHINECPQLMKLISSNLLLELKNLEKIEVRNCHAMEELIAAERIPKVCESLQVIDIQGCRKLKKILSSSSKLQLGVLKNLEEIDVRGCIEMEEIIAIDDVDCKKELIISLPKLRKLTLIDMQVLKSIINVCGSNGVILVGDSLQVIDIQRCRKLKKILSSSSKLQLGVLKNLEEIDVRDCWEMEEIIAIDDVDCKKELIISLPKLRKLTLRGMYELKSIINVCGSNGVILVCDSLQVIDIQWCRNLKKVLSSSSKLQLGVLKNLEEIDVRDCYEMEEIIAIDDVDCKKELIISLPKLRKLTLRGMWELKSVINVCGSNRVLMVCDSLQEIVILDCPQLKRLPIYVGVDEKGEPSPPPALKKIYVFRKWWEALEWNHLHPNAQTILLPFCKFY